MSELLEQQLVAAVRRELPQAVAVYLFGSLADARSRPDSDVDVAVLLPHELPPLPRWEAQERVAAAIGRSLDLVDLRQASTVLRAQVVATGRVIYDGDPQERHRVEGESLSAYARLNEDRREVLERIRAEGRIHG